MVPVRLLRSVVVTVVFVGTLVVVAALGGDPSEPIAKPGPARSEPAVEVAADPPPRPSRKPAIFDRNQLLVAYYGTAGTGSLGVLGEAPPDEMDRRLRRAARPYAREGQRVQPVYELIVTIADARPGPDGDHSHHLAREQVEPYLRAARRHDALVLLDLQTGRGRFIEAARHWRWALRDPRVGLALDPEWRMGRRGVPGGIIGSVGAREVNRVSRWLARLTRENDLPEKLFVVHQFRTSMVRGIRRIRPRDGLAMVQHVDGFGTRAQKMATYDAVAEPKRFTMGLKLFYDEDIDLIAPPYLHRLRPKVHFISFQ